MITVAGTASLGVALPLLRSETFGFAADGNRLISLTDFPWLLAFAREVWRGNLAGHDGSVFTVAAHLRVTRHWTGLPAESSYPFAYSPTMLWILAPLCWLPERLAFAVWTFASLAALGWLVIRFPFHWLGLLVFLTPLTLFVFAAGQTAFLSTAALFSLMIGDSAYKDAFPERTYRSVLWRAAVLFLLTAKPQLALTAGVAMLATRERATLLLAAGLALLATLAAVPWLGAGWTQDYLHIVSNYDRVHLDSAFAWSLKAIQMSNLRALLYCDFGVRDDVAVRLSAGAWLVSLAAIVVASRSDYVAPGLAWPLCVLAFLVFCPHLSPTEDVALFCMLGPLNVEIAPAPLRFGMAVLAPLGLWLSPAFGPARGIRPSLLFCAKVVLFSYVLAVNVLACRWHHATSARRPA